MVKQRILGSVGLVIFFILFFWLRHFLGAGMAFSYISIFHIPMEYWFLFMISMVVGSIPFFWRKWPRSIHIRPVSFFIGGILVISILLSVLTLLGLSAQVNDGALPSELKGEVFYGVLKQLFGIGDGVLWLTAAWNAFLGGLLHLILLISVVMSALGFGGWIRYWLPQGFSERVKVASAMAVGLILMISVLWLSAVLGVLATEILGISAWALVLFVGTVACVWQFRTELLAKKEYSISPLSFFLVVMLFLLLSSTLGHLIRPIPIGWDDISVYMNIPKLLAEGGKAITGYGMYNWGLVMSLGFLLGGTSYALSLSFLGGVLALYAVYVLVRELLKDEDDANTYALLGVSILATTPMILFQMGEDLKVDLAMMFFTLVAIIITLGWVRNTELRTWPVSILIGTLLGVAMGIKVTALLVVLLVGAMIAVVAGGGWFLMALLGFFSIVALGLHLPALSGITISTGVEQVLLAISSAIGIIGVVGAIVQKKVHWRETMLGGVIIVAIIAMMIPWLGLHYYSYCAESCDHVLSGEELLFGASKAPILPMPQGDTSMETSSLGQLENDVRTSGGSKVEEVARYAGFDQGIAHFLSLPLDVVFSKNISGDYVTVGWVYIVLGGLLLLFFAKEIKKRWLMWSAIIAPLVLVLLEYVLGEQYLEIVSPEVTMVVAVMLPLLWLATVLYVMLTARDHDREYSYLMIGMVVLGISWVFLGGGVPWYGITLLGVIVGLGMWMLYKSQELSRILIPSILVLWIIPMGLYRFAMTQTHQVVAGVDDKGVTLETQEITSFDQRQFILYMGGLLTDEKAFAMMNKGYYEAGKILNGDPHGYIYRVGTLLPYFIHRNNTRMLTDNQLDVFLEQQSKFPGSQGFHEALIQGEYSYIIYDVNTASIEQTTLKTLLRKTKQFEEVLSDGKYFEKVYDGGGFIIYHVIK